MKKSRNLALRCRGGKQGEKKKFFNRGKNSNSFITGNDLLRIQFMTIENKEICPVEGTEKKENEGKASTL